MTELIIGSETLKAIQEVLDTEGDIYAAVAYWNGGAGEVLGEMAGEKLHVVLDVNAGGTSALELEYLIEKLGEQVKVHPNLHTKTYASQDKAVVGSSNASRPGLQLETTSRVEASILVNGRAADSVDNYARELFNAAEVANKEHVEICRQRFMRKRLAEAEAMEGNVDFLTALWERRDLLDEIPLIITYEETDSAAVSKEFNCVREELAEEGEDNTGLDQTQWTDFNWKLDNQYDRELCISIHRRPRGGFEVALVRPVLTTSGTRTFAKYQPWSEIGFLSYQRQGFRKIQGKRLQDFRRVFKGVKDKEGFVRVKDLELN